MNNIETRSIQPFYRDTYIEVNLDAIHHNIREYRRWIGDQVILLVTVKANAYGHGMVPIAKAATEAGVDRLGVAFVDEGIQLRKAGITIPILVLGYTPPHAIQAAVQYDLAITVYSSYLLEQVQEEAKRQNKKATIHIKLDTGMGRLGIQPSEVIPFLHQAAQYSAIYVEGLYTHFSTADEKERSYFDKQIKGFEQMREVVKEAGFEIPIYHSSNSAATMVEKTQHHQMVRVGVGLYGMYPSDEVSHSDLNLIPALRLVTKVSHLKKVSADHGISYGKTYTTQGDEWLATLPIGYADGYSRSLSNKGFVLLNGVRVPVVGTVCMDQLVVRVDEAMPVQVGDEAVVYGMQGGEEIRVDEVAKWLGTINYEVTCMLQRRIPRIYTYQGKVIEVVNGLMQ
ncbi:alanine racemase [Thermoactinomyces sp. DSM 45892]|uniref:alanine racemase n=1 Tax=Thermoactinomyces sp. DSM 45892 TaxID=1882753 RepID=UPI00089B8F68|nr:alanine racemase [Thermoactinomyces sp. DSM 45892]SDZ30659.1 alanine racemase [Thermoactinomyces sp. DSM 45892]